MKVGKLEKTRKIEKMGKSEKIKKTKRPLEKSEKSEKPEGLVRVKDKFQVTIPNLIREIVCVEEGDVLEVTVINQMIVFKPMIVMDRDG